MAWVQMIGADDEALVKAAHLAVTLAVQKGALRKPDRCIFCRHFGQVHMHHRDYTKPLDVLPVCGTCHQAEHHGKAPRAPGEWNRNPEKIRRVEARCAAAGVPSVREFLLHRYMPRPQHMSVAGKAMRALDAHPAYVNGTRVMEQLATVFAVPTDFWVRADWQSVMTPTVDETVGESAYWLSARRLHAVRPGVDVFAALAARSN